MSAKRLEKSHGDSVAHEASSPGRVSKRRKQKLTLTCANCRARKVRCEGSQPTCRRCETFGEECRYNHLPPMSKVLDMAKRLEEAEKTIAELQSHRSSSQTGASLPDDRSSTTSSSQNPGTKVASLLAATMVPNAEHGNRRSSVETTTRTQKFPGPTDITTPRPPRASLSDTTTPQDVSVDVSIDESGALCYYGPTSAVHDPLATGVPSPQVTTTASEDFLSKARSVLVAKAKESRMWEGFAISNATVQSEIPRQVVSELLRLNWTWTSPMFMWVYRPAFMDDMSTAGRYYSEFLLVVMCAHAASFYDRVVAERLISKARLLLGSAIHQESSLPTVQALLVLSARDLGQGSISQAWLFSGMAFRMARDLGLHLAERSIPNLNPVDIEVRRRLFWGCYFWDKAMSLYTGRLPALTELPEEATYSFLDDSAEEEYWMPLSTESCSMSVIPENDYPLMKGHIVSCFTNSCKLSIIINDIIQRLYSKQSQVEANAALETIQASLEDWRSGSPAHLRYEDDTLPPVCPPPHILSQNLLYHATVILAHRPFWVARDHYQACISAAHSIEKLLLLLERTFTFSNITYMMAYCVYTGASAILPDAQDGDVEALAKIRTFTRALESSLQRCPLVKRSLKIIEKGLKKTATPLADLGAQAINVPPLAPSYIPAFPYVGLDGNFDINSDFDFGMGMDHFSALDCFPEAHMNAESPMTLR